MLFKFPETLCFRALEPQRFNRNVSTATLQPQRFNRILTNPPNPTVHYTTGLQVPPPRPGTIIKPLSPSPSQPVSNTKIRRRGVKGEPSASSHSGRPSRGPVARGRPARPGLHPPISPSGLSSGPLAGRETYTSWCCSSRLASSRLPLSAADEAGVRVEVRPDRCGTLRRTRSSRRAAASDGRRGSLRVDRGSSLRFPGSWRSCGVWLPGAVVPPPGAAHCRALMRSTGYGPPASSDAGGTTVESCDRGHLSVGDFPLEKGSRKSGQTRFVKKRDSQVVEIPVFLLPKSKVMRRRREGASLHDEKVATNAAHGVPSAGLGDRARAHVRYVRHHRLPKRQIAREGSSTESARRPESKGVHWRLWLRLAGFESGRAPPAVSSCVGVPCGRSERERQAVTWLILPVVICLSQRLSHAGLSTCRNKVRLRTAHYISYGSLDLRRFTWITLLNQS